MLEKLRYPFRRQELQPFLSISYTDFSYIILAFSFVGKIMMLLSSKLLSICQPPQSSRSHFGFILQVAESEFYLQQANA